MILLDDDHEPAPRIAIRPTSGTLAEISIPGLAPIDGEREERSAIELVERLERRFAETVRPARRRAPGAIDALPDAIDALGAHESEVP